MAKKTKAQMIADKDNFTDGGGATANKFRLLFRTIIDSLNGRYSGPIDCSSNPDYPASDEGEIYRCSVSGRIGGASGKDVTAGDLIMCIDDAITGNEATVGTKFIVIKNQMQHFIKKDEGESDLFTSFKAGVITLMTDEIDLTATATDVEITIPSGFHMFMHECGVIITDASAVVSVATMRFGEGAGSEASLIAATALTGIDALNERKRFTSLLHDKGVVKLSAGVTAAGSAGSLKGRAYFIGFVVQDE